MTDAPRVAMISGASRGIGRAIAERLLEDGWHVSAGVRDMSSLPERRGLARFGYEATEAASAPRWVAGTVATFGRIDALVCSAGILLPFRASDGDEGALERMLEINVKAPLRLARAAWPHLVATGHGRIAMIASLSGKRVTNDYAGYAMSKFALVAATHALRREGWDKGVRATAICPSFVATDMSASMGGPPPETMTQPADLARLVATVLTLPETASVAELTVACRFEPMF
jgi:NAD(P)-dependent dehydrogenase (short-subunit alcohol dehydrogenase family)